MTGEIFKLAEVQFQDGPYQPPIVTAPSEVVSPLPIRAIKLTSSVAYDGSPSVFMKKELGTAVTFLTPWPTFLFVFTICDPIPDPEDGWDTAPGTTESIRGVKLNSTSMFIEVGGGKARIIWWHSIGVPRVGATWTYPCTGLLTNFMLSIDAATETVQLAVGDTVIEPDVVEWTGSGDFEIPTTITDPPQAMFLAANGGLGVTCRIVRFWATSTIFFFDLTDVDNRRYFVDAANRPVTIPENGTLPGGVLGNPTEWLHARVAPEDFRRPGLWEWQIINGPLTFDLAACSMP